jgi:acyl carrier protein
MSAVINAESYGSRDADAILAELKRMLVAELNVAVFLEHIDENVALQDLNMDSVALIELISAAEARFGFTFADSDLVLGSFASLRALSEVIARRIDSAAPL